MRLAIFLLNELSPALAGRLVERIWFGAQRYREPSRETRWRASAQQSTLCFANGQLAVYVWGDSGPAVLLVHGWSGRGTQMAAFAEPLKQAGYRVVAFDAPAHGHSTGRATDIFQITEALRTVDREYGPFDGVIAHSFGGMVVARALHDGMQTRRVICISPPAQLRFLIDSYCHHLRVPLAARQQFILRLEKHFGTDLEARISSENTVRSLSTPALIIHDENDHDVPLQQGQILAQAWPGAKLVTTRGLGHRRILRDQWVMQTVLAYLQDDQPE